jgi:dihydrofolate reductase
MRDLAILTFVTLDGVMQAPGHPEEDTSGGFSHGGWSAKYWDEVMEQVMREAMADPYCLVLGRKTYDTFAAHWPNADDPVARKLNDSTKYVVTSNPNKLDWKNSIRVTGDIAEEITRLKKEEGPLLQGHGSWQLIQHLLARGLIDEFRLWTFPVVVGSGKRLFDQGVVTAGFTLTKTEATSNGVVMSIYRSGNTERG